MSEPTMLAKSDEHAADLIADQVMGYAAHLRGDGLPVAIVANAFFRAAVAILITHLGVEVAAENMRLAADRLEHADDDAPRDSASAAIN